MPSSKSVPGQGADIDALASQLNFHDFLDRDVNHNFSGGEIKRSELLQLMAQQPDLVLLDEPESGVDLENIVLLGDKSTACSEGALGFRIINPKGSR